MEKIDSIFLKKNKGFNSLKPLFFLTIFETLIKGNKENHFLLNKKTNSPFCCLSINLIRLNYLGV